MGQAKHGACAFFQNVTVDLIAVEQGDAMLKKAPFDAYRLGSGAHTANFFGQLLVGKEAAVAFYPMIDEITG